MNDGDTAVYRYNALGQRVYKRRIRPLPDQAAPAARQNRRGGRLRGDNGIERRFAYDEQGRLLGVYDARGRRVQEYVYLGRRPVAVVDRRGVHYIHPDHLGTPRAVSEPNGPAIWRWHADPFGTTAPDDNPEGRGLPYKFNLRFPGQYFDRETRRHYNYFRTYDSTIGRYITSDPTGLWGGVNNYLYTDAAPTLRIDPRGLESVIDSSISPGAGGPVHFGVSAGGWWQGGPVGVNPESGFAVDTNGTFCIFSRTCANAASGMGVGATLGISGSIGEGRLCSGTFRTAMVGGAGFAGFGAGTFIEVGKNGASVGRGIVGLSGEMTFAGAGGCIYRYICFNESSECDQCNKVK